MSEDALKKQLEAIAEMPTGLDFLKTLMKVCRYDQSNVIVNQLGDFNFKALIYHEAQRNVWLALRPYIKPEYLAQIEIGDVKHDNKDSE
jgi:hypothetical protein